MYGRAEAVLSHALGERRRDAFVATKVWTSSVPDGRSHFNRQLAWFGGRIDLLQVHNLVAWREHLDWMERERGIGNIGWLGATTYQPAVVRPPRDGHADRPDPRGPGPAQPARTRRRGADPASRRGARSGCRRDASVRRGLAAAAGRSLPGSPRPGFSGWPEALLRWTLSDERVTVAIPASGTPDHAVANAAVGSLPLLEPEVRDLIARFAA